MDQISTNFVDLVCECVLSPMKILYVSSWWYITKVFVCEILQSLPQLFKKVSRNWKSTKASNHFVNLFINIISPYRISYMSPFVVDFDSSCPILPTPFSHRTITHNLFFFKMLGLQLSLLQYFLPDTDTNKWTNLAHSGSVSYCYVNNPKN